MKRLFDESVDKYWILMSINEAKSSVLQNMADSYEELFNTVKNKLTKYKEQLFWGKYEGDKVLFFYVCIRSKKWFKLDLSCPHGKWLLYLKLWKNKNFSKEDVPKKIRNAVESRGFSIKIEKKGVLLREYENPSSAVEDVKEILDRL